MRHCVNFCGYQCRKPTGCGTRNDTAITELSRFAGGRPGVFGCARRIWRYRWYQLHCRNGGRPNDSLRAAVSPVFFLIVGLLGLFLGQLVIFYCGLGITLGRLSGFRAFFDFIAATSAHSLLPRRFILPNPLEPP
jgi:hypothetical protein